MSETWTEYGWQDSEGRIVRCDENTIEYARKYLMVGEKIVGRTVVASDWLPADTPGQKGHTDADQRA